MKVNIEENSKCQFQQLEYRFFYMLKAEKKFFFNFGKIKKFRRIWIFNTLKSQN